MDFAYLHAHSEYTLTDGSMTVDEYLDRLEELEIPAAALTDTHNLFGAFKFHEKAMNRGIKPILGVDLRVAESERPQFEGRNGSRRMRVLVEDRQGYERLSQLISDSYRRRHERGLFVSLDKLASRPEGLLFLGPPASPPSRPLKSWDNDRAQQAISESVNRFGDRFYVEVPLYPSGLEDVRPLAEVARDAGVTAVPTRPAYFTESGQEERLRLRRAVQKNQKLDDSPPLPSHRPNQFVADPETLANLADQVGVSPEGTMEVVNRCHFEFDTEGIRLPRYPFGEDDTNKQLAEKCRETMGEKSLAAEPSRVDDRLSRELEVIQSMGFSDYFLIVADVVNWAKQNGIRVGPGRGSAAGSLVAYLLDITTVDPFEYDLIFERFLNPQRNEMPDIDIDFADDRREEVIEYIRERFGDESVAHIITFGNMKARNSIRDVGRIRGEPQSRIDELAETIPSGTSESLERLKNRIDPLKQKLESSEELRQWFKQAQYLEGMVRNASVHAAGILLVEGRLDEEIPLYYTDDEDAVPASQFDMYDVESMGFLKLDILGLKTLTLIDRTLDQIPPSDRPPVDGLPDEDETTFEFLMKGSLEGVFQFESAGSRKLVRNMEPENRKDIVDCIALYRPGPMEIRDDYLKRRRTPDLVEYPHEDLKPILEDTYGLILYQEQVMAIARKIGGFSWSEADTLRKAMGKKRADLMKDMKQDFVEGATENGYEEGWARELFDTLAQFAEYGFNRSHSAAYGEITYITAYLKAHFTAPFYAGFLSIKAHDRDRIKRIIQGMREDEIELYPPCVNRSGADFQVENGGVRYGLRAIKHVGGPLAREIERVREEEPFEGVIDFVERIDPSVLQTQNFQALAAAGCFDTFDVSRGALSDQAEELLARGKKRYRERDAGQSNMFGDSADQPGDDEITEKQQWSRQQRRRAQKKVIGYVPGQETESRDRDVSLVEFTYPGSVERFGELASERDHLAGPPPQLVARLSSEIDEGSETLLELTDGEETIMVRVKPEAEIPTENKTPLLFELDRDGDDWVIISATPVPSGDDLGIEIHLGSHQDLNQLRQLKKVLIQASGSTPVHLVVDNDRLDVSTSVEPSRDLRDRIERIVGNRRMRLCVC